jgi:hypothetical protein
MAGFWPVTRASAVAVSRSQLDPGKTIIAARIRAQVACVALLCNRGACAKDRVMPTPAILAIVVSIAVTIGLAFVLYRAHAE